MSSRTYASSLELRDLPRQTPPSRLQSSSQRSSRRSEQNGRSNDTAVVEQHLEPTDRGPAAWRLLGAAFVFEALLWGKVSHCFLNITNIETSRFSTFLWSVPELLLSPSAICQQSVHSDRRHGCLRNFVPWSPIGHSDDKALFEISKTDDMVGL